MEQQFGLDADAYNDFKDFLKSTCGIELGDNKEYLVATRVRRIISENQLSSLAQLTQLVKKPGNERLKQRVIDAMTTNETYWFRDGYPFDYFLRAILPEFEAQSRSRRMRVWSAACSAGQEPYSISIVAEEYFRRSRVADLSVDIMATDLSNESMHKARTGEYDRLSVARGLSEQRMSAYFNKKSDDIWVVNQNIRERVQFRPLNLQDSYAMMGKFDVIFCRNVLIYFSAELKREILRKLSANLNVGGYLFLGASESITGAEDLFKMINCNPGIVYQKL